MLTQTSMFKKFIYVSALAATLSGGIIPHARAAEIRTLEQVTLQHDQIVHQLINAGCVTHGSIAVQVKNMFFQTHGMSAEGMPLGKVIASVPTAQLQALLENLSEAEYMSILEELTTQFFDKTKMTPFYLNTTPKTSQKNIFVALGKSLITCATRSPQVNTAMKTRLMRLIQSLHKVEETNDANLVRITNLAKHFRQFMDLLPANAQNQLASRGILDIPSMLRQFKQLLEQRINN